MSQMAPSNPSEIDLAFLQDQKRVRQALESLGPAIAAVHVPVSPSIARAAQATENAWRRIENDFGMHSSRQIAKLLGFEGNRTWASVQRARGNLLGVQRGRGYQYPGFQVGPQGQLSPAIRQLLELAGEYDWSNESLALWLGSSSGSMPEGRAPAEFLHTDPDRVIRAAREVMEPAW